MISLVDVEKTYAEASVDAVRGVSLSIGKGELVAIVGPSGSGKSTLLHLIGGLDRATKGTVRVHDQDLATLDDDTLTKLRRDRIGFVFQFFNLMPTLTALENVMLPALLGSGRDVRDRAHKCLKDVGLESRVNHRPDQLSGGEMQRVAVARALIMDPPLLLADEPTGNLDTKNGEHVLELIIGSKTSDRTVVVVTHDRRIAERAQRIIEVRDGRIVS
jgi:putative ABC transport system ATP-binding protein